MDETQQSKQRKYASKCHRKINKSLNEINGDASAFRLNQIAPRKRKRNLAIKRELVRHHIELRAKGMKQLAEIKSREGDKTGANIIQQISKAEESKRDWKIIQQVLKPQHHSGLTSIEIHHLNDKNEEADNPEEAVTWQRVSEPAMVTRFRSF
jgi:hypothetical protein